MKTRILILLAAVSTAVFAQMTENDVRAKLELINSGKIDQVQSEIPSLQNQYPNDPGVAYLDAMVTTNGSEAAKKYQAIVDNYPNSVWADDALYKVYQYFYSIGLYKTAESKIAQLKEDYPSSIYVKQESVESGNAAQNIQPVMVEPDTANGMTPADETLSSTPAVSTTVVPQPAGAYAVQVGVYSQQTAATKQAAVFTQTVGRSATVFPKESGGKILYAVLFEGFTDEQSARAFGADLKSKFNMDWFLVKK